MLKQSSAANSNIYFNALRQKDGHQSNNACAVPREAKCEHAINDSTPKILCNLSYVTVDNAIGHILNMGPGALLANIDVKHALCLLPVHPANCHLLAMSWKGDLFIDMCLPFGLRSAPKLFNVLADLLFWILERKGISPLIHYLDDFLTMGQVNSAAYQNHLTTIEEVCHSLGISLTLEKSEGPSQCVVYRRMCGWSVQYYL